PSSWNWPKTPTPSTGRRTASPWKGMWSTCPWICPSQLLPPCGRFTTMPSPSPRTRTASRTPIRTPSAANKQKNTPETCLCVSGVFFDGLFARLALDDLQAHKLFPFLLLQRLSDEANGVVQVWDDD